VLAKLERYVGEGRFQAGVRLHMDRHQDGTATAEDFIASASHFLICFLRRRPAPGIRLSEMQRSVRWGGLKILCWLNDCRQRCSQAISRARKGWESFFGNCAPHFGGQAQTSWLRHSRRISAASPTHYLKAAKAGTSS
jgi:hypothetical protein